MNEVNEHDQPHGPWNEIISVYSNGELHAEGEYINGERDGSWTHVFYSYQGHTVDLDTIMYFKNGFAEGEAILFL